MSALIGVPGADFERLRHLVWPFLEKMAARSNERLAAEDLAAEIKDGSMQLWILIDGARILAAGITQIVIYPRYKVCRWLGWGGSNLRGWLRQEYEVEDWARAHGCTEMQAFVGKRVWIRLLAYLGYSEDHVLLSKAL